MRRTLQSSPLPHIDLLPANEKNSHFLVHSELLINDILKRVALGMRMLPKLSVSPTVTKRNGSSAGDENNNNSKSNNYSYSFIIEDMTC